MRRLFTNNANSSLASGISSGATSLALVSGGGALFPNPNTSTDQAFSATLVKSGNTSIYEVILCTQRSTDTFSVIARGQQGTTALSWNAGDLVYLYPTAGDLAQMAQFDDLQAQAGNTASDTGSANAYVAALSPTLLGHAVGLPIRFVAGHTNTGASTLNDGYGTAALQLPGGTALPANTILAGGSYEAVWTGSVFNLIGMQNLAPYLLISTAASTYAPIVDAALEGTPTAPNPGAGANTEQIATCNWVNTAAAETYSGTAAAWSVIYPNGWIVNGGILSTPSSSPTNVNFHTPFTTSVRSVSAWLLNQFQEYFVVYPYPSLNYWTLGFGAGGVTNAIGYLAQGY